MSLPPDPPTDGRRVLPPYVRYPVIVVLVGIGLIGVITVVSDAGWLPIAGPFVAVVVASVIVFVVMWWRSRRLLRLSAALTERLQALGPAVVDERGLPASSRPSSATDQSLEEAARQVDAALQQLAWGHEQGAVPLVVGLADQVRREWRPDAPLSRQVEELAATATEMEQVISRMLAVAAQRRSRG